MKIFGADSNFNQAKVDEGRNRSKVSPEKAGDNRASSSESKASATVAVSTLAKEVGKAGAKARVAPDIRREKVEAIKEKVDNGTYHIDGDKIAGKIIEDIIKQGK